MLYFDTGTLLKLYTAEPESAAVQRLVTKQKEALWFSELHHAECVSAMQLKRMRGECGEVEVAQTLAAIEHDRAHRVLHDTAIDWSDAWERCRSLSAQHAVSTGCRTLDALHVACALQSGTKTFYTTDKRQAKLATKSGLRVPKIV